MVHERGTSLTVVVENRAVWVVILGPEAKIATLTAHFSTQASTDRDVPLPRGADAGIPLRARQNLAMATGAPCTTAVEAFRKVRDMPYALDGGHDADGLEKLGAGDCLAKSDLLARKLRNLGLQTRLARWRYLLPDVVPEVADLPSRLDVHRAVLVHINGDWVLVDATHDPGLRETSLVVADWDGRCSTPPAYSAVGVVMIEGQDDADIRAAVNDVKAWTSACDPGVLERWRHSYIGWLAAARRCAGTR
jgi:hypothetical protein